MNISTNKGLTLVELLVVISIFLIITGVAIFNYRDFSNTVSLQNLTDDVALSIRKAQSFAIGARAVGVDFNNSYGVHFSTANNPSNSLDGSKSSFLMFATPTAINKYYDVSGSSCGTTGSECIEFFEILTIDEVKEINIHTSNGNTITRDWVDIVFTRPDPRADICYSVSAGVCTVASSVDIVISNGQVGDKYKQKTISIQNTGQISIE